MLDQVGNQNVGFLMTRLKYNVKSSHRVRRIEMLMIALIAKVLHIDWNLVSGLMLNRKKYRCVYILCSSHAEL